MSVGKNQERKWALFSVALMVGAATLVVGAAAVVLGGNAIAPAGTATPQMCPDPGFAPGAERQILDPLDDPTTTWLLTYDNADGHIGAMTFIYPGEDPGLTAPLGHGLLDFTKDPNKRALVHDTLCPDPLPWKVDTDRLVLESTS